MALCEGMQGSAPGISAHERGGLGRLRFVGGLRPQGVAKDRGLSAHGRQHWVWLIIGGPGGLSK